MQAVVAQNRQSHADDTRGSHEGDDDTRGSPQGEEARATGTLTLHAFSCRQLATAAARVSDTSDRVSDTSELSVQWVGSTAPEGGDCLEGGDSLDATSEWGYDAETGVISLQDGTYMTPI